MDIRAAVIEPVGGHSGMDYYDYGLCSGLLEAQVSATLYTCNELGILKTAPFAVKPTFADIYGQDPALQRGLRYLRGAWRTLSDARQHGAHIIHLHFFHVGIPEFSTILLSKLMASRVVVTAHDVDALADGLSTPLLTRWAYKMADRIVAHNQVSRQELVDSLRVDPAKTAVIPHGNYIQFIRDVPMSSAARDQLGLPKDGSVLLFFGQIKAAKGLEILLKALPRVVEQNPKTRLVIAGRPWKDDFSYYAQIIKRSGLEENCILHIKHIPHESVAAYFAAADLVVLPYRKIYQSGVLLMSMSYGKPVLASALPGMMEVVEDGRTGYLFPTGDVDRLGDKINYALSQLDLARQVGEAGLELMAERYDWEKIGHRTAALYRSLT